MRHPRLAWFGCVVVFATAVVSAQTSQQRPTFRSGVEVIEIDVSVIDGDGRPITDLEAPEFTVTVDGEPRRVVQAQFVSLRPPARDERREPEPTEVFYTSNAADTRGRLIVIAVDQQSILFGEGRGVMRAAGAFLDQLGPRDRVALLAVPQPGPYIDFTSNHDLVRRAVEGMSGEGDRVRRSLNIGLVEAFAISEYQDQRVKEEVIARVCGGDPGCAFRVPSESSWIVQEVRYHVGNSRRALESVLEALRDVEGPKVLVWISGGLPMGRDTSSLLGIEDLAAASRTTVYVIMVDEPLADITEASAQPTLREDRRMKESGLHQLASITRGALFRAHFNPGAVFDRLEEELSGYYLLGVEARPTDRDEDRHGLKVSVRRRGAHVRARREYRFTPEPDTNDTAEVHLARMLRSPVPTRELPLRIATYAYQDAGSALVRVLIAAEVDGDVDAPSDLTLGYKLLDREAQVVSSGTQHVTAKPVDTPGGPVLEYSMSLLVAPGTYSLKLAVVDAAGRRGSVERAVHAWQLADEPLAVGDLMVTEGPSAPGGFYPQVEARVASGWIMAYTELYAESASILEQTHVEVEVADDESGPTRVSAGAVLIGPSDATRRIVKVDVPVDPLPPGRYVARVRVMRNAEEVARLYRPFRIAERP